MILRRAGGNGEWDGSFCGFEENNDIMDDQLSC